jgi:uncharacterized protein involved in exopolysaccharide biosynthesis
MAFGPPGRPNEPIGVIWMALALVLAAFVGASLGLLWHWSGLGDDEPAAEANAGED